MSASSSPQPSSRPTFQRGSGFISGYSATTGVIHSIIAAPVATTEMLDRPPLSLSSRPILEMLAGIRGWQDTKALIAVQYALSAGGATSRISCGLLLLDPGRGRDAFAIGLPPAGGVVPAVRLGAAGGRWTAEACVLRAEGLEAMVVAEFLSASVTALVAMAEDAFVPILKDSAMAESRLTYLCQAGDLFIPDRPDTRKWTICSCWPDWQLRRLSFDARAYELHQLERRPALKAGTLRQMCLRAPLHLVKGDRTDT